MKAILQRESDDSGSRREHAMRILVTGGTNGMGKGVAKVLASMDQQKHEIIILGRSQRLGESVVEELRNLTGNQHLSFVQCDLTKLGDVKKAIAVIHEKYAYLDGIFINAGLGYAPCRVETEDSLRRSGKMITFKKNQFMELEEASHVVNQELRNKLWDKSLALCADEKTSEIARVTMEGMGA